MSEPLVSVNMITYNHKPYIAWAIEGVLQQKTSFPFELVIGEDCSTDGTREVVLEYQKKYPGIIRAVTSDRNVGAIINFYRTQKACRGKYVAFCDGDDYWHHPEKLQKQADYLEAHSECGLVYSDHDRFFVGWGKKIEHFFRVTGNTPPEDLNVFRGWGPYHILTCTVMARRDIVDSVMSDPTIYQNDKHGGGTDVPLFIEVTISSKAHYIDDSLSTYTVQLDSASNIRNPARKARFVRSNIEAYLYLAEKYGYKEEKKRFEQQLHRTNLWIAFWEKDTQLARDLRKRGWENSIKAEILYWGATSSAANSILRVIATAYIQMKDKSEYRRLKRYVV